MVALNSPQLLSKRYLSWRILRSPGDWAKIYIERAKDLRTYKSAIVFPEQLLPIAGAGLYSVEAGSNNGNNNPNRQTTEVQVSIVKLNFCRIELDGINGTVSVEQIYDWEHENQSSADINRVRILTASGTKMFIHHNLFSGKKDALAFAKKQLARIVD